MLTFVDMRNFITLLLLPLLCSCTAISSIVHDDEVVARVGKDKLYKSELLRFIPQSSSPEDSAKLASRYINSWATDRLYLKVAEDQLSKSEIDVSAELEAYRLSLVKYRYEQRYISDRLDTLVTPDQLSAYYQSHRADFVLQRPILKVRFADLMKDSPNKSDILRYLSSEDHDEFSPEDSLTVSTALRYFDNSDVWMDARDLAVEFGVDYPAMLAALKNNMIMIEPEGRGDLLVAYVCDIRRDGVAPLEFCSPQIRDIILSARKHQLVKGLERDLLETALESKQFVIY